MTGTPWPTLAWATGLQQTGDPDRVEQLLDRAFRANPNPDLALTLAIVVVQGGRIVAERYRSPGTSATTPLISWSTAKSITHAAVGIAIRDGLMSLHEPLEVPEWSDPGDPRQGITLDHLLAMRPGLRFSEDYVNDGSDCLEMLFGRGAADVAHYAASLPLDHPPDSVWNYSSGTTNIICRALGKAVGGTREATEDFLRRELFGPLGMTSASPRFDEVGTWIGSSYVHATARDFARFGLLYLRQGWWEQRQILPESWVDHASTPRSEDGEGGFYGHHWWVWGDDLGTFAAHGYEGQRIIVVPPLDLVVVRLGKTPADHKAALQRYLVDLVDAFRPT